MGRCVGGNAFSINGIFSSLKSVHFENSNKAKLPVSRQNPECLDCLFRSMEH